MITTSYLGFKVLCSIYSTYTEALLLLATTQSSDVMSTPIINALYFNATEVREHTGVFSYLSLCSAHVIF